MTSRLASLLVQEGIVSAKKMAEAFQRQVIYGGTLDTILLEMDIIDEPALIDALGRASQLPTAGDLPSAEALTQAGASRWFPHSVCERYHAVPISLEGNVLRVLVIDPPDRKQLDELGYMLSLSVDPIIVPEHRFMQAVELVYHVALPARFQSLAGKLRQRAATASTMLDPQLAKVAEVAAAMVPKVNDTLVDPPKFLDKPAEKAAEKTVEKPSEKIEPIVEKPVVAKVEPAKLEPKIEAPRNDVKPAERITEKQRAVVTDVPMPTKSAPKEEMPESPTPRFTTRQAGAPVTQMASGGTPMPIDVSSRVRDEPAAAEGLRVEEAVTLIDCATDRDGIFEAVCRGARSQLEFVALFTVQGDQAHGKIALAKEWVAKEIVARVAVKLDTPSALQTTARSLAPFLGRLGDEPISEGLLQSLGRKAPSPAILLPIVLKERTVALLYGDASGKPVAGAIVAGLSTLTAAAARAFQRLILKQKGGEYSKGPGGPSGQGGKMSGAAAVKDAHGGAWRSPGGAGGATEDVPTAKVRAAAAGGLATAMGLPSDKKPVPRGPIHDLPTQQIRQVGYDSGPDRILDMDALISSVLMGDDRSHYSAEALVALGDRAALAVVARMPGPLKLARHTLHGPTPPLAEHGPLLALVARFGKSALGPLLARLNDPSVDVRYYVTLAVGELKLPETVGPLGQRLLDDDAGVRGVAIQALSRYGESREMRTLTESMRGELPGPDPLKQQYAAEALGALRDAESVPRMIELVKHPDAAVVLAARHALLEITKQDFGTSRWRWRSWWERHRGEPRLEWLLEGLGHPEAEVRESASEELRSLSSESFGYHFDLPKREREEARRQWVDWWRTQKKN